MNWNYDEFICYLLIFASHSDMEFSDEEKAKIKEKVSEATFDKILAEYENDSDFEKTQKIIACKGVHYPTEVQREELIDRIMAQFSADGDYSIMEQNLMKFLKKLL